MDEKYLYNGYEYTKQEVEAAAQKKGLSFDAYVQQKGLKPVSATPKQEAPKQSNQNTQSGGSYVYNGYEYSPQEVEQAAQKKGLSVADYISQKGLKKKDGGISSSPSGSTQQPTTAVKPSQSPSAQRPESFLQTTIEVAGKRSPLAQGKNIPKPQVQEEVVEAGNPNWREQLTDDLKRVESKLAAKPKTTEVDIELGKTVKPKMDLLAETDMRKAEIEMRKAEERKKRQVDAVAEGIVFDFASPDMMLDPEALHLSRENNVIKQVPILAESINTAARSLGMPDVISPKDIESADGVKNAIDKVTNFFDKEIQESREVQAYGVVGAGGVNYIDTEKTAQLRKAKEDYLGKILNPFLEYKVASESPNADYNTIGGKILEYKDPVTASKFKVNPALQVPKYQAEKLGLNAKINYNLARIDEQGDNRNKELVEQTNQLISRQKNAVYDYPDIRKQELRELVDERLAAKGEIGSMTGNDDYSQRLAEIRKLQTLPVNAKDIPLLKQMEDDLDLGLQYKYKGVGVKVDKDGKTIIDDKTSVDRYVKATEEFTKWSDQSTLGQVGRSLASPVTESAKLAFDYIPEAVKGDEKGRLERYEKEGLTSRNFIPKSLAFQQAQVIMDADEKSETFGLKIANPNAGEYQARNMWREAVKGSAQLVGQMVYGYGLGKVFQPIAGRFAGAVGEVGEWTGTAKAVNDFAMVVLPGITMSWDGNAKDAYDMFGAGDENAAKRILYTGSASFVEGAAEKWGNVFEQVGLAKAALTGVKGSIFDVIKGLSVKEIKSLTAEQLEDKFYKAAKRVLVPLAKGAKQIQGETMEEEATTIAKFATAALLGANMEDRSLFDEMQNTAIQTFATMSIMGGVTAGGSLVTYRNSALTKNSIYNMGSEPDKYRESVQDLAQKGELTPEEVNEKMLLINTAEVARKNWDLVKDDVKRKKGLSHEQALQNGAQFVQARTNEMALQKEANKPNIAPVDKERLEKKIAKWQNVQRGILDGEVHFDEIGTPALPAFSVPNMTEVQAENELGEKETVFVPLDPKTGEVKPMQAPIQKVEGAETGEAAPVTVELSTDITEPAAKPTRRLQGRLSRTKGTLPVTETTTEVVVEKPQEVAEAAPDNKQAIAVAEQNLATKLADLAKWRDEQNAAIRQMYQDSPDPDAWVEPYAELAKEYDRRIAEVSRDAAGVTALMPNAKPAMPTITVGGFANETTAAPTVAVQLPARNDDFVRQFMTPEEQADLEGKTPEQKSEIIKAKRQEVGQKQPEVVKEVVAAAPSVEVQPKAAEKSGDFIAKKLTKDESDVYENASSISIGGEDYSFAQVKDGGANNVFVVEKDGVEIGKATLNKDGYFDNIRIDEKHRRKGLATKMYDYVESVTGKELQPSPIKQSPEAKKLWEKKRLKESVSKNVKGGVFAKALGGAMTKLLSDLTQNRQKLLELEDKFFSEKGITKDEYLNLDAKEQDKIKAEANEWLKSQSRPATAPKEDTPQAEKPKSALEKAAKSTYPTNVFTYNKEGDIVEAKVINRGEKSSSVLIHGKQTVRVNSELFNTKEEAQKSIENDESAAPAVSKPIQPTTKDQKPEAEKEVTGGVQPSTDSVGSGTTEGAAAVLAKLNIAPFFSIKVNNKQEADNVIATSHYKKFKEGVAELAKMFGVEVVASEDGFGGFAGITEVSTIFQVKGDWQDIVDFTAVVGALVPEVQEATIASLYVNENDKNKNAERIEFPVNNEELARQALEESGLSDDKSGFSVIGGKVILIDYQKGHPANDPKFDDKYEKLIDNLKKKGVKYGESTRHGIQSEYLDRNDRQATLAKIKADPIRQQQGGAGFRDVIAKAEQRNDKFIRERIEYENKKRSDSENNGKVGQDEAGSGTDVSGAVLEENKSAKTQDFFTEVEEGKHKPNKPLDFVLPMTNVLEKVYRAWKQFKGNFDAHIETNIPVFRDVQLRKINAIAKMFPNGARLIDLGGSTGAFGKAITFINNKIKSINLDANEKMRERHNKVPVKNSDFVRGAFLSGFDDVQAYKPTKKFDVVHESMLFQFITWERGQFIDEIADNYITEDGIVVLEEKLANDSFDANEAKKDQDFKLKYYDQSYLTKKKEQILTGMAENQASQVQLEVQLARRFKYVEPYWDGGNFKGYIASNNRAKVDEFLGLMGDTTTEFSSTEVAKSSARNNEAIPQLGDTIRIESKTDKKDIIYYWENDTWWFNDSRGRKQKSTASEAAYVTKEWRKKGGKMYDVSSVMPIERTDEVDRYIDKARQVLTAIFPDAELVVYETEAEYEAAGGTPNTRGEWNPRNNQVSLNLERMRAEKVAKTPVHEVIHPIVRAAVLADPELENRLVKEIERFADVKGVDVVFAHANRYAGRPSYGEEVITEFYTRVADGTIDLNNVSKDIGDRIMDVWNAIADALAKVIPAAVNLKVKTVDELKNMASAVKLAFDKGDVSKIQSLLGEQRGAFYGAAMQEQAEGITELEQQIIDNATIFKASKETEKIFRGDDFIAGSRGNTQENGVVRYEGIRGEDGSVQYQPINSAEVQWGFSDADRVQLSGRNLQEIQSLPRAVYERYINALLPELVAKRLLQTQDNFIGRLSDALQKDNSAKAGHAVAKSVILTGESWSPSALYVTRGAVFINSSKLREIYEKVNDLERFMAIIDTALSEEVIHSAVDMVSSFEQQKEAFDEISEEEKEKVRQLYPNADEKQLPAEYFRILIQEAFLGTTSEFIARPKARNILAKALAYIRSIFVQNPSRKADEIVKRVADYIKSKDISAVKPELRGGQNSIRLDQLAPDFEQDLADLLEEFPDATFEEIMEEVEAETPQLLATPQLRADTEARVRRAMNPAKTPLQKALESGKAKNVKWFARVKAELAKIFEGVFGLNKEQSDAASELAHLVIVNRAKLLGISVAEAYANIAYQQAEGGEQDVESILYQNGLFSLFTPSEFKRNIFGKVVGVKDSVLKEIKEEMALIKKNAIKDGRFRIAPNNRPSNLNEAQWLMVRTKRFKNWFGDWRRNPSEASKIVDENGEPKVYYSGSAEGFDTYSKDYFYTGEGAMYYGAGFYFTPEKTTAEGYGKQSQLGSEKKTLFEFLSKTFGDTLDNSAKWVGVKVTGKNIDSLISDIKKAHSKASEANKKIKDKVDGGGSLLKGIAKNIPSVEYSLKELLSSIEFAKQKNESRYYDSISYNLKDKIERIVYLFGSPTTDAEKFGVNKKPNVHNVFLNVRRPLNWENGVNDAFVKYVEKKLSEKGYNTKGVFVGIKSGGDLYKKIADVLNEPMAPSGDVRQYTKTSEFLLSLGVDGVVHTTKADWSRGYYFSQKAGEKQIIAFEPNQIKSATSNIGTFSPQQGSILYQTEAGSDPYVEVVNGFYSPIEKRIAEFKQDKASAQKWKEIVGVKSDEAVWTGVADWLNSLPPQQQVSKAELAAWMKDNRIEVREVKKSDRPFKEIKNKMFSLGNDWEEVYGGVEAKKSNKDGDRFNLRINGVEYQRDFSYPDAKSYIEANADVNPEKNRSKFSQYQLEGNKSDYVELYMVLPREGKMGKVADWQVPSAHQSGDPLVDSRQIVRVRGNMRIAADGSKTFFIEEIQGDKGQQGRKGGFFDSAKEKEIESKKKRLNDLEYEYEKITYTYTEREWGSDKFQTELKNNETKDPKIKEIQRLGKEIDSIKKDVWEYNSSRSTGSLVSTDPFSTETANWVKLGLKLAMRHAVKNGATKIAWTTGEQQNERYDLSKQVERITVYRSTVDGKRLINVLVTPKSGIKIDLLVDGVTGVVTGVNKGTDAYLDKRLEDIIGKEMSEKIISSRNGFDEYEGEGLKIGGSGMKGFYGSPTEGTLGIVGRVAKSLAKQEVGTVEIDTGKNIQYRQFNKLPNEIIDLVNKYKNKEIDESELESSLSKKQYIALYENGKLRGIEKQNLDKQNSIDITPEIIAEVSKGLPLFQQGLSAQGAIVMRGAASTIFAMTNPNVTTPLHELSHAYFDALLAAENNPQAAADVEVFAAQAGVTVAEIRSNPEAYTKAQELFARGFEKYLYDGKAPNKELQSLFDKFANWLREIYKTLAASPINVPLNDAMREVYGRMLTPEQVEKDFPKTTDINVNEKSVNLFAELQNAPPVKLGDMKNEFGAETMALAQLISKHFDAITNQLDKADLIKKDCK